MNFERPLTDSELDALRPLVKQRGSGAHRLFGRKSSGHWTSLCSQLIPRPDTETLDSQALLEEEGLFLADVGAGTGCVGLSWPKSVQE